MIEGNVIKFGYGTILTAIDTLDVLVISHIESPLQIDVRPDLKNVKKISSIKLNYKDDIRLLKKKILEVNQYNHTFEFRGFIFDFSNYNSASISVMIKAVNQLRFNYWSLTAC